MSKRFLGVLFIPLVLITVGFFISSVQPAYALDLTGGVCTVGTEEKCKDLLTAYTPGSTEYATTRVSGTLLGLNNFLQGVSNTQPAPANLAFWWNDNVNRIPFAGKALAADTQYSGPFLQIILGVWKLARDVSYGLMAIVMLVVGFMIITRKKIGPQAAVTAQQALPRIVIALILITFSYPIGALGASAAFVMRGNASQLANNIQWNTVVQEANPVRSIVCDPDKNAFERVAAFVAALDIRRTVMNFTQSFIYDAPLFVAFGKNANEMSACGAYFLTDEIGSSGNKGIVVTDSQPLGKLVAIMFAVMGGLMGNGVLALLISLIVIIASMVFGILVYIKFFMLYLKLLFSIVGAPLQFAFGAIPGNEAVTTNWFKNFASLVISIPAMFFVLDLAWGISINAIKVALVESGRMGGGTLMLVIVPFFYIFGANLARQIPDKINAMIVGEPKKGGKR